MVMALFHIRYQPDTMLPLQSKHVVLGLWFLTPCFAEKFGNQH